MNFTTAVAGPVIGLGIYGATLVGNALTAPEAEPRILTVAQLFYTPERETFTQQLISESGNPIRAKWAVQISRVDGGVVNQLCAGGSDSQKPNGEPIGLGIYNGETDTYGVDDWVGAECPDLASGDRVEVSWEYTNHFGVLTSVGRTFTIE